MTLQLQVTLILVAVAAAYLGRMLWKSWRKMEGGSCCGKSRLGQEQGVTFIPSEEIGLRRDRRTDKGQIG